MIISRIYRYFAVVAGLSGLAFAVNAQSVMSPADRDAAARSAYARGDATRATATLTEAVRLNPFDPVALNNLAVSYAAQGDYQNAVTLLERALRLAPNRSDIVNNLANLKAWMAQDSQFAVGSRGTPQALNFPRAEDTPPELPPLWAPAAGTVPVQPQQIRPPAPAAPVYQATPQGLGYSQPPSNYPSPGTYPQQPPPPPQQMVYPQQPGYNTQPTYGAAPTRARANYSRTPVITERPDYATRVTVPTTKGGMITERASETHTRKKKKRAVLDCPVP